MYSYVLKADTKNDSLSIECNWCVKQCQKVEEGEVIANIKGKRINAEQSGYVWLNKQSLNKLYLSISSNTTKYVSRRDNLVFEIYDTFEDLKTFHPDSDKFYLDFCKNKNYYKKDEPLSCVRKGGKELLIKAEEDGYYVTDFERSIRTSFYDEAPNIIYTRYDSELDYCTRGLVLDINAIKDAFTGRLSLKMREAFRKSFNFLSYSAYQKYAYTLDFWRCFMDDSPFNLRFPASRNSFFTFEIQDSECLICFIHPKREYKLQSGDKITLLFSNNKVLEYKFNTSSKILDSIYNIQKCVLTGDELNCFCNEKFLKARIEFADGSEPRTYNFDEKDYFADICTLQHIYSNAFRKAVMNANITLPTGKPEEEVALDDTSTASSCYVYLMFDTTTNFYKIGISNNPEYREKTLQSEKPTILKICSKKYPHRKIARAIEKALHETFQSCHVRGEWYNLSDGDVNMIIETLT